VEPRSENKGWRLRTESRLVSRTVNDGRSEQNDGQSRVEPHVLHFQFRLGDASPRLDLSVLVGWLASVCVHLCGREIEDALQTSVLLCLLNHRPRHVHDLLVVDHRWLIVFRFGGQVEDVVVFLIPTLRQ